MVAVIRGTDLAEPVRDRRRPLRPPRQLVPGGDAATRSATAPPTTRPASAAVLAIGRAIAAQQATPRRSVMLALWDREEDGLLGSRYYIAAPARPAGEDRRLRQLRHPGREPAAEPAQHQLRGRRRDRRRRLQQTVRRAIGAQTARHRDAQLDLRPGPQRLRQLPRQAGARASSSATRPGPATTRARTRSAIVDFGKLDSRSPSRCAVTARAGQHRTRRLSSGYARWPPSATRWAAGASIDLWLDRDRFSAADQDTLTDTGTTDSASWPTAGRPSERRRQHPPRGRGHVVNSILTKGACDGFLAGASD